MLLKRIITILLSVLFLALAHAFFLYATAPVEALRGRFSYHHPGMEKPHAAGVEAETFTPFDQLPPDIVILLTVAEDRLFFRHKGIDVEGIKVAFQQYTEGKPLRGASTITQQLVKNLFLTHERSWWRKYKEIIYTFKMEQRFSKEEIFALYVSIVEVAPGVYGMEQGAQHYFRKPLGQLSVPEKGLLVAVLPSPKTAAMSISTGEIGKLVEYEQRILYKYYAAKYYMDKTHVESSASSIDVDTVFQKQAVSETNVLFARMKLEQRR